MTPISDSGIRDNRQRGSVGEFLRDKVQAGSKLSIVSAYFTMHAYEALKNELDQIESLRFLYGEPHGIQSIDPDRADKKAFAITEDGLQLQNQLEQKRIARECSAWIEDKVEVRSLRQSNLLHGKMYHTTQQNGLEDAIMGSSNFTVSGLGLSEHNSNIELNLEVNDRRDRQALKESIG